MGMIWQAWIVTVFGWLLQVASSVADSNDNDLLVKTCFTLADLLSPPTNIISQSEDNNHLFLLGLCIMQVTNSVNEPRGNDSQVFSCIPFIDSFRMFRFRPFS